MSTLTDRPNTALLVIDVQNDVVAGAHDRDGVVATIAGLVERARQAGTPVVWVQHGDEDLPRDSEGWQYVPELARDDAEPLVHKEYGDSFEATDLEDVLAGLGVGHLVVAGAHTTEDQTQWGAPPPDQVIAHTNLYWTYQTAPGRKGGTVVADEVDFSR